MKTKKHPKANLENYSKLFLQLGLVLSLFVIHILLQQKTFEKEISVLADQKIEMENQNDMIIFKREVQPKVEVKPKADINKIKKVIDEVDLPETNIVWDDPDTPVELADIKKIDDPDDIIEDVPLILVEEAPIFPGCEGSLQEIRDCFEQQIRKFVNKNFDRDLAETLNLSPGNQKIMTVFKIDNNGFITDIFVRAPHLKLKQEGIRVLELLPRMEPGKRGGKNVRVSYALPIVFRIE